MGPFSKTKMRGSEIPIIASHNGTHQRYSLPTDVTLQVNSSAFPSNGLLPSVYRFDGHNCNPPLQIKGIPETTRSLLIILEQRDAPVAARTHWICWDIPADRTIAARETRGINGRNDFLHRSYTGPYPQDSLYPFCFVVYALRSKLHLPFGASRHKAEKLLASQLLACGELAFYA